MTRAKPVKSRNKPEDPLTTLVARRAQAGSSPGEVCIDAEVLAAYADGGLATDEIARVDAHLATCSPCRTLLARLSPVEAAAAPAASARQLFRRIDPQWLALAAMLIVGASLWLAWPRALPREAASTAAVRLEPQAAPPVTPAPRGAADEKAVADAPGRPQPATAAPAAAANQAAARQETEQLAKRGFADDLRQRAAASGRMAEATAPSTQAKAGRSEPALAGSRPVSVPAPPATETTIVTAEQRPVRGAASDDSSARPAAPAPAPAVAEARREAAARRDQPTTAAPDAAPTAAVAAPAEAVALADAARNERAAAAKEAARESDRPALAGRIGARTANAGADAGAAGGAPLAATAGALIFMEPERRLWWRIVSGSRIDSSSDGGNVWNGSLRDPTLHLLAGSAPEIGVAWVAGARGVVLRRVTPLGWQRVTSPTSDDLVAIAAASASSARATTRAGREFETSDGGTTWTAR